MRSSTFATTLFNMLEDVKVCDLECKNITSHPTYGLVSSAISLKEKKKWGSYVCHKYLFFTFTFIWQDPNNNRIGQWLNQTSNSKLLQLSYDLNSEAREGRYQVIVTIGLEKIYHNFKVEKYGKLLLFYNLPFQSICNAARMLINIFYPQFCLNLT